MWPRAIEVAVSQTSGLPEAAVIQQLRPRAASFALGKQSDVNIQTLNTPLARCAQASCGPQMKSEVGQLSGPHRKEVWQKRKVCTL